MNCRKISSSIDSAKAIIVCVFLKRMCQLNFHLTLKIEYKVVKNCFAIILGCRDVLFWAACGRLFGAFSFDDCFFGRLFNDIKFDLTESTNAKSNAMTIPEMNETPGWQNT